MNFKEEAAKELPYIKQVRRHIHQHPELTYQEKETTAYIEKELHEMGIRTERYSDFYGLMGIIKGSMPGKTVLLRADIDALPISEETEVSFKSSVPGVMHACGHDCHSAMLLGAARLLQQHRDMLKGTVILLFQAAEESGRGAEYYVKHGITNDVDAAMAIHVMGDIPEGTFNIEDGPRMASCTNFTLTIHGSSAHGSTPHLGHDAIVAASAVILGMQTIVTRENDPLKPLVLTIGTVRGGKEFNIISDKVTMTGTIRSFDEELFNAVPKRLFTMAEQIAESFGCRASYDIDTKEPPACNSDTQIADIARNEAKSLYGESSLQSMKKLMGSEDFSYIMAEVPSVLCFLGYFSEKAGAVAPLHTPTFCINDDVLDKGAALYARFAADYLCGKGEDA